MDRRHSNAPTDAGVGARSDIHAMFTQNKLGSRGVDCCSERSLADGEIDGSGSAWLVELSVGMAFES
jgi:hypothetical protein